MAAGSPDRLRLAEPHPDLFLLFSPYEPLYLVYAPDAPNIRYQVSFKSSLFNPEGKVVETLPWLRGLYLAYTQTSLWNFSAPSSPFYDTSYKPELFLKRQELKWPTLPGVSRLDFQTGLQHESNGKDGDTSRSLNLVYLRPTFLFGDPAAFHISLAPRLFSYIGDLSDNPDIADYRGHGDLTVKIGRHDGLQLATRLRAGDSLEHLTAQFDLTYPLWRLIPSVSPNLYLQAQYFKGYGESLLDYQNHTESLRLGIAIWR